jgi:hypothetical protein
LIADTVFHSTPLRSPRFGKQETRCTRPDRR